MKNIKKYVVSLGYTLGIILLFTLFTSILSYYKLINDVVLSILELVIPIISTIVGGFFVGIKSEERGYKSGIIFGILYTILNFIFALIFSYFKFKLVLFYLIIIASAMFGSMIGINKRKEK